MDGDETRAQREQVTPLRSHSQEVGAKRLAPVPCVLSHRRGRGAFQSPFCCAASTIPGGLLSPTVPLPHLSATPFGTDSATYSVPLSLVFLVLDSRFLLSVGSSGTPEVPASFLSF